MEFEITAPDGRTLSIDGDSMPNEQELEEIFANVKSNFNSSKAKTSDIYSIDGLPSDTPSKLMQVGEFLKEGVAKPVAQGYFNLAKGIGGMMNWYADQSRLSKEDAEALDISEDVRQKLNTFSDILNIAGDSVRFGSEEWLEKEWLKSDPEVFKGEFFENPSWTRASAAVASALPSFTSIVAFGKSNFALGYALMAGSENADIYLEAKEKVGEEKASGLFLAGTAGTAAIDISMKPIEKIIKPLKGGFINRMAERAIRGGMEALPESLQQVYQNAVKKYGYDATQSLWSGVIESAIGGFGMGAVAAGAEGLIEQGATEEEVEQLQNVAVESIIANSKELNDIAYQDMKKTLTKINDKFASMSEDDVMRIGRELEEGFSKYYRELSEIMPEEQARSNAALIRNHAFFASDAMGISPKEYFDKYAPKIDKMNFDEFNGQKAQFEEVYKSMNEIDAEEFANGVPEYTQPTININGVEHQTTNSDGSPIAKSEKSLRYFYNWFGDSKVVDEQGRPLVMYHGTSKVFDAFDKLKRGYLTGANSAMEGFWFSSGKDTAQSYAEYSAENSEIQKLLKKQRQMEKMPLVNWAEYDNLTEKIEELQAREEQETPIVMPVYLKAENVRTYDANNQKFMDIQKEINDFLQISKDKDGVIIYNLKDAVDPNKTPESATHIMVREPNQIKSTSNRGTYSESENIYYQSAWHGGRELEGGKFSLKYAGKQVGLAHGYGVYASANVTPATGYRSMVDENITYKGKNIAEVERELRKAKENDKANLVLDFAYKQNREELDKEDYSQETWNWFENEFLPNVKSNGKLYEVDVPEDAQLIEEKKPFSEQTETVREAIKKLNNEDVNDILDDETTGEDIYGELVNYYSKQAKANDLESKTNEAQKLASQALEKVGIKGIAYYDNTDGRCFVIFNPDDVKVIQKFYQDEQAPRGAFANDTIYLFENANESTLPHELTHSWQKELRRINETNPTEKLTGMLEQIDNWTSSEFTRKYNVSKRNYGYAVIDKRGNVVYDNRGNGFLTEQDAVEYAKDEIFARGFEQYVREGKAPNNSLKQAFRNFFMWLKKIYRDAMDLNIQLSPDIKNVYADLLGGVDVDFFLDATPESFIQQRIKLGEQREKTLDGIIQDAQANKQIVVKTKRGKGFSRVWATAMIPLSTRAKRISPKLRNVLRKYEFTLSNELNKKYDKVRPFMDLWKNMSEDDIIAFDFALKNDYVAKQLEIVDKYNARKEWEAVRETLENIYDDALNAGLDINWRPDYFPRKVKDVDGFLSYLHNAPEWTRFQQAISEAGLDGATAEEQAEFLNKYLRGFVKVDLMPNRYGSEKERKIDIIDNEMNQFYAPSIEALVGYIEGLNSRIVSSKFLGKGDNIEESIGGYLTYLLNNNIIAPEQIDEARNILRARFDARGVSNPWLANMRNYSYMYTMGGINSAITQIEDLSVSMYKAGVWNTLTTAMESKRITKKDLGLDSISAEFVEQSKSASYLNKLFKLTGLDGIDSFGKETLVNAELKKFQKMNDETLREYIEPIMEEETNATIQDIRNNNISDNVLYLMFSELSDVQPISLSELPEFYNRGGNLRILYMLKSFALKRIDIFRNECIDKIKSKDFNQVKEGMQNLLKLSALMVICGSSKDWLIDLLYGRETDMSERVLNNILGLVGLSKFQIYQAKEKGFTGTVKDIVVPPLFAVFDDLFTDVAKGIQGKREIKDFEVWKGIPLVGRFYYWWVGRGSEKQKKNKKY